MDLLLLGSRVEAEVRLTGELAGIVIPALALVDDHGGEVAYVQLGGESFDREVQVEARQGTASAGAGHHARRRISSAGGYHSSILPVRYAAAPASESPGLFLVLHGCLVVLLPASLSCRLGPF